MTMAICQKCGAEKFGAFTRCSACGYCPLEESERDIALALLFSDQYMNRTNLQELGRDIAAGVDVEVEQEPFDAMTRQLSPHMDMLRPRARSSDDPDASRSRMRPFKKWWQFWGR